MPNMYARGILFGKMVLELGDTCTAKNEKTGMFCDLEFKTKGFFSGTYNAIAGKVRNKSTEVGEISGKWSTVMDLKNTKVGQFSIPPQSPRFHSWILDGQEACAVRCNKGWRQRCSHVGSR